MRFSSLRCGVVASVVILLAGCSEDPGLQERLNRLQAEMQEKDRQLHEAQSALEKTKSELKSARASAASKPVVADAPASTPPLLSKEQIEESYASASKAMQKRVAGELRNYSVENCTQFPVVTPSDEYPYHSKIALALRSDNGRSYHLEFPVSADAAGKWTFPGPDEITSALAENRQSDQTGGTPISTARPSAQGTPQLMPGQTATETRVIDWGGGRSPNNARPTQTPAAAGSAVPVQQPSPQNHPPAQTMPSEKDVTIHW